MTKFIAHTRFNKKMFFLQTLNLTSHWLENLIKQDLELFRVMLLSLLFYIYTL